MPRPPRRLRDLRLGSDQAVSDADQTSSDADQGISDRDQDAAEADQLISDSDQEAADLEFEAGETADVGRTHAYEEAQAKRGEGTLARSATSAVRAQISAERDAQATRRDEHARRRDETAEERDSAADLADRAAAKLAGSVEDIDARARTALGAAATARSKAAAARIKAAEDRRHAARDREAAARDRQQLQAEIHRSQLGELTGAYRRGIGELLVSHEMERVRRIGSTLHLALIDVDRLKATNDDLGHAAGGDVLRQVFAGFQARLRPYDPIISGEGTSSFARYRESPRRTLATVSWARDPIWPSSTPSVSVSTGLAVLDGEDTLTTLVARADAALIEARRQRRSSGAT